MCAPHFNAMTHVAQAATLKHFWGWDNVSAGQQRWCFCMVRNKRPLCESTLIVLVWQIHEVCGSSVRLLFHVWKNDKYNYSLNRDSSAQVSSIQLSFHV